MTLNDLIQLPTLVILCSPCFIAISGHFGIRKRLYGSLTTEGTDESILAVWMTILIRQVKVIHLPKGTLYMYTCITSKYKQTGGELLTQLRFGLG